MATPKTVIRGHFGVFYDQFRLSTVRAVPTFGGADNAWSNRSRIRAASSAIRVSQRRRSALRCFPGGLCVSSSLTDAQIQAGGLTCPAFGGGPGNQFIGIDRLNRVVAPGHAFIPG